MEFDEMKLKHQRAFEQLMRDIRALEKGYIKAYTEYALSVAINPVDMAIQIIQAVKLFGPRDVSFQLALCEEMDAEWAQDPGLPRGATREMLPPLLTEPEEIQEPEQVKQRYPDNKLEKDHLYFIQGGDKIKIGRSKNPLQRLETLKTATPDKLKLLAMVPEMGEKEGYFHKKFNEFHLGREWFEAVPEIITTIDNLRNRTFNITTA